jgi:hypothetical protein
MDAGDLLGFERDAAVQTSGSRRRLGARETFPPCKPLKTNETELESRQILPCSKEADATAATVSPNQKESRRCVHPRRRSREIGGPAGCGGRNFPVRKPLRRLETEKESGRPSLLAPARASVQGNARLTPEVSSLRVGRGRYQPAMTGLSIALRRELQPLLSIDRLPGRQVLGQNPRSRKQDVAGLDEREIGSRPRRLLLQLE